MNICKGHYMKKAEWHSTDTRVPVKGDCVCRKCKGGGYINKSVGFIQVRIPCLTCRGS